MKERGNESYRVLQLLCRIQSVIPRNYISVQCRIQSDNIKVITVKKERNRNWVLVIVVCSKMISQKFHSSNRIIVSQSNARG